MTSSIFAASPAIRVSDGIYRSPDQNLFGVMEEIDWGAVSFECREFVRRHGDATRKYPRWLFERIDLIGNSRSVSDFRANVDGLVDSIEPNSHAANCALAFLIALWKAGAIVFPSASIAKNSTQLSKLTKNFKLSSYLDEIQGRNGRVDELLSALKKKLGLSELTMSRIQRRSLKGLLTIAPIRQIHTLSDDTLSKIIEDAGDNRGKEFAYIGLAYFNDPSARYRRIQMDMKNFLSPFSVNELKRNHPSCKWVLKRDPSLDEWRSAIEEFLATKRQLKGLTGHINALQHLLKYLLKYPELPREVLTFLHRKHNPEVTITAYILGQRLSTATQGHYLSSVSQFFEWYLDAYCSEPSEEDGLPVRLFEFANPISAGDIPNQSRRLGQTHRIAMPYRYVEICKEIITRNDFEWPKSLKEDYFSAVDHKTGERIKVWSPVRAYALLMKFLLPLRTHQVRLLESGEGDHEHYDRVTGQWRPNNLKTKKHKKPTGVIRKIWDGQRGGHMTGLFINTNKTKTRDAVEEGYVIPWQNDEVINLAARLQEWQVENYPLKQPTRFANVVPSLGDLPTKDVIASTPDRYYLFRDLCGRYPEAPVTSGRLQVIFVRLMEKLEEELWERKITNADGSKISLILTRDKTGNARSSIFDLHSLRVTGLTAFVKAGVPIHILSKLVAGHSTFLMTLYYAQMDIGYITDILSDAQTKIADNAGTELAQALATLEAGELRKITAHNSAFGISAIKSSDSALWSWMDWGICPVNNQKCNEGGEAVQDHADRNYFAPVKGGAGNCPLCRFFITGPQFLLGLVAKFNETMQALSEKGLFLREKRDQRQLLLAERRNYEQSGIAFPNERKLARATSAYETLLDEVNTTAETLHAIYSLIEQSKAISDLQRKDGGSSSDLPLIKTPECNVTFAQASEWEAQDEVCRSARFFDSINWRNANLRRSNAFNLMMQKNGMSPVFIGLSDEVSKVALDKLSDLMMKRLKRDEVRLLMEGEAMLSELGIRNEIKQAIEETVGHSVDLLEEAAPTPALPKTSVASRGKLNGS
jgi:hypothetical protein